MKLLIKNTAVNLLIAMAVLVATQASAQIVIEDLSRSELKAEIEKIENEFYRVYNATVENKRFKIECRMETPTNSHISVRICEPGFLTTMRNRNVQNFQNGADILLSPQALRANLQAEFEELTAAMIALLEENEYFRELDGILGMLRGRMQELEQQ